MELINLYGEDGITIYLTVDYDLCDESDPEAAIRVVGHRVYASSLEQARRSIKDEYMDRLGLVMHPYHGWISKDDPAVQDL